MALTEEQIAAILQEEVVIPDYELGKEKVIEFGEAVRNSNPAFWDLATAKKLGYDNILMPPTMVAVIGSRWQKDIFSGLLPGLDISKILHVEQKITFNRPIVVGETLSMIAKVESIKVVAGMNMIVIHSELKVGDEPVADIRSTFINKEDVQVNPEINEIAKGVMKYGSV